MTQAEYLAIFRKECDTEVSLTSAKNGDYADDHDAFANFRLIEDATHGRVSTEDGILTRMSDKFRRVATLLGRPNKVSDESVLDTLRDLSVYAKILRIYLMSKQTRGAL